jgi:hypothetical protein
LIFSIISPEPFFRCWSMSYNTSNKFFLIVRSRTKATEFSLVNFNLTCLDKYWVTRDAYPIVLQTFTLCVVSVWVSHTHTHTRARVCVCVCVTAASISFNGNMFSSCVGYMKRAAVERNADLIKCSFYAENAWKTARQSYRLQNSILHTDARTWSVGKV